MRSDVLNKNSNAHDASVGGFEFINATKTLTQADSGKIFALNSTSATTITLPTDANCSVGCHYKFIVQATNDAAYTIKTGDGADSGGDDFVGGVILDPPSDNWVRTIYIDDHRTESTGAKWKHEAKVTRNVDRKVTTETYNKGGGRGEKKKRSDVTTTITTKTNYRRKLTGPSREFNYVENVKVSSEVDPWMRSRNVFFASNGLRPFSKHYLYLDSQTVDIVPKLCEINMKSGTFTVYEDADILDSNDKKVGFIRIQKPNHKFGDTSRPDIGAGLGSPAVLVEEYTVGITSLLSIGLDTRKL